jgi:TP901-1 family phage major tail protein
MTAQKGKDLLLKVDTNGAGSFVTVAGLRARTLAFNAATVDVTDTESVGRWRELLDGAGVKTARITGSGIFKDASTDETVRQYFFNGTVRNWQVIVTQLRNGRGRRFRSRASNMPASTTARLGLRHGTSSA